LLPTSFVPSACTCGGEKGKREKKKEKKRGLEVLLQAAARHCRSQERKRLAMPHYKALYSTAVDSSRWVQSEGEGKKKKGGKRKEWADGRGLRCCLMGGCLCELICDHNGGGKKKKKGKRNTSSYLNIYSPPPPPVCPPITTCTSRVVEKEEEKKKGGKRREGLQCPFFCILHFMEQVLYWANKEEEKKEKEDMEKAGHSLLMCPSLCVSRKKREREKKK